MAKEPEIQIDVPRMRIESGLQLFTVYFGNNQRVRIAAHEPHIEGHQPTLRFHRFRVTPVTVQYETGVGKNKEVVEDEQEEIVGDFVGAINAGAWIAFFNESAVIQEEKMDIAEDESPEEGVEDTD